MSVETKVGKQVFEVLENVPVTMSREEWLAEGEARFGKDMRNWRFMCPNCGNVQTVNDFLYLRDELEIKAADPEKAYYSCIGRYDTRIPDKDVGTIGDGKSPCNYTSGGLFCLAKLIVIMDGKEIPCFEFAEGVLEAEDNAN